MTLARLGGVVLLIVAMTLKSLAQVDDIRIDVVFGNAPLADVFRHINKTYPVNINFYEETVKGYKVRANIKNTSVSDALDKMLKGTDLVFERLGNSHQYLITAKLPSERKQILLEGQIIDKTTSEGIFRAYVLSSHYPNNGVYAQADGSFSIEIPYHEDDTLIVGQLNYHILRLPLKKIYNVHQNQIVIPLLPKENKLAQVKIQDKETKEMRALNPTVEVPTQAGNFEFDPTRLGYLVGLGEADILRTLQTLPGVSSISENAGQLNIRGGSNEENLILIDGIPVYQTDHFLGLIGGINTRAVQKVKLYSSGYDVSFGGRTGGVIEMDGRPTKSQFQQPVFSSGLNILNYSGFAQTPFDKNNGAFMITGRSSFSGVIETRPFQRLIEDRIKEGLIFKDIQTRDTSVSPITLQPSYTFFDINAKAKWLIGKKDILSLSFLKGRDKLHYFFKEIKDDKNGTSYNRRVTDQFEKSSSGASLSWNHYWSRDIVSKTRLVFSGLQNNYAYRLAEEFQDGVIRDAIYQENFLHDWSLQNNTNWDLSKEHTLQGGFHIQYLNANHSERQIGQDTFLLYQRLANSRAFIPAVYLQDIWKGVDNLTLKYGMRYTYLSHQQKHLLAPRASLDYRMNENWSLKAAAGRYYQYLRQVPYLNDLGLAERYWMLSGTDSLPVLSSTHVQGGFAYNTKNWTFGVEMYGKMLDGLTTNELQYNSTLFTFYADTSNSFVGGTGHTIGADVFAKYQKEIYTGWVSYTLGRTRYQFDEINNGEPFFASQDRRHMVKVVQMLKWDKIEVSALFTWMKGNPITEFESIELLENAGGLIIARLSDTPNGLRLPDYHRLDLTSTWTVIQRKDLRAQMGISVFNVYNRVNVRDWIPGMTSADIPNPSINDLTTRELLGISPNLFINLEF